ncbi:hypothetical protein Tco_0143977 [Tanacetum coccineum]
MAALKFASSHNMQFWATTKVKTINREVQIQALVDKKKVIISETSVRSDLQLEDAEGTECLPNAKIFEQLTLMGYENLTQKLTFYKAFFSPQWKFLIHTILQCLSAKTTAWNEFSSTMASVVICLATNQKFNFSKYIFDNMVKNLEGGVKFIMYPRFVQVFLDKQVEGMSKHKENYVTPSHTKKEDASKQGWKIDEINQDAEVTLVDETQGRYGDNLMFDNGVLDNVQDMAEKEVDMAEKDVSTADPVTTAGEVVTTVNVVVSTAEVTTDSTTTTTVDELTLAQTLIEIKVAKPKVVTTAATTTTTVVTRPKARGVVVQEPSEFTTTTSPSQPSQLPQAKDKGKAKMVEPEKPLKKKDQIMFDKEVAQKLQAQLDAELEEEEKLARQREEDANIAEWDNVQAMIDADYELAARLQAEEQGELTIEEKSRLFVELMNKRKKHFARLRAEEQRRKPPTKAQKRNTMSTYLKNMAGYKHNQLKTKSFEDIQMLFDKEMKRVNTFVDMDTELVKDSKTRTKESSKRAGEELESENLKKQKLDENVGAEVDDDQEEAEMKKHMEIVHDDEVAIDAIPLATKSPIIVDWKIIKEGKMEYFQIIRADGSSKRYSSTIQMLQNIDREDLETFWKLVKAKHGLTRPDEGYERVL